MTCDELLLSYPGGEGYYLPGTESPFYSVNVLSSDNTYVIIDDVSGPLPAGKLVIPETLGNEEKTVIGIAEYAFSGRDSIRDLCIAMDSDGAVGNYAFEKCEYLRNVSVRTSELGYRAFYNCTAL